MILFSADNKNNISINSISVFLSEKVKVTMFFSRNDVDVNINVICLFSYILISQGLIRHTLHPKVYFSLAQNCQWYLLHAKNAPKNKPVWVMGKCMVSMATYNAILKNGSVPTNSIIS